MVTEIRSLNDLERLENNSQDEIVGTGVLETTPSLVDFINTLHNKLKSGGKATISAPYFAASEAYNSPLVVRSLSEQSLNWANKSWRDINKVTYGTNVDFEITVGVVFDEGLKLRADDVQLHWRTHYINVIKVLQFILVKK